jgi:hypothetical protein
MCNKSQQDALFYSQFISKINPYMFQAGLLLIIRRYFTVYTAVGMCYAFMVGWLLAGLWILLAARQTFKVKVKESHYRPSVAQRVVGGLGSQIFMTFGT